MVAIDVPTAVATKIAAGGLSLTLGTNLFVGPVREPSAQIPKNCVFVSATPGGAPPNRTMGQSFEIRAVNIHTRVRWSSYSAGATKARDITDLLQGATISGYLDVSASLPEPAPEARDPEGLYYWGLFHTLTYQHGP